MPEWVRLRGKGKRGINRGVTLESRRREELFVTKIDAAKRQIECAIGLWFAGADPISIHTLTAAARRLLLDLSIHRKKSLGLFDTELYIVPGKEKEYKKAIRKAETFFKHANDDPDATLKFNPDATDYYLLDCCDSFSRLSDSTSDLMSAFLIRVFLFNPKAFTRDMLLGFEEAHRIKLREFSRQEFLNAVLGNFAHFRSHSPTSQSS